MSVDSGGPLVDAFVERAQRDVGLISKAALDAGWRRMEEPLAGRPTARARRSSWRLGLVAGLVMTGAVAVVVGLRMLPGAQPPLAYTVEGSVLRQGDTLTASTQESPRLLFSDESHVALGPGTRLTVGALDARGARVVVLDGTVDVFVKPRAGAAWVFGAGPFQVHVKGTAFRLGFSARTGRLDLHMTSGWVEVTAPPDRTLRVAAGDSIELFAEPRESPTPESAPATEPWAPRVAPAPATEAATKAASAWRAPSFRAGPATAEPDRHRGASTSKPLAQASPDAQPSWAKLLTRGQFEQVVTEADKRGITTTLAQADAADLSALADAARYTKRFDLARLALLSVRNRFTGSEPARDASFFLGRLGETMSGHSPSALAWYETYLREAPSGPYAGEALGRRMTLLVPIDKARASQTAKVYLERFPHGPQSELARSLLGIGSE
jgi:hypothetical protein